MTPIARIIFVVITLVCMLGAGRINFEEPAAIIIPQQPAPSVTLKDKIVVPFSKQQVKCLADNIYYEAADQPYEGKLAVAFVTMNRLADQDYPNSICSVVYEKRDPRYCQFSWVCQKPVRFDQKTWQECQAIAQAVVEHVALGWHRLKDPSHGALFFHTTEVSPRWKTAFIQTTQIADHIFYRKPSL